MRSLRRLASAVGWLSHQANQAGILNLDHASVVRPSWIFCWSGLLLLLASSAGNAALISANASLSHSTVPDQANLPLAVAGTVTLASLGLLMLIGFALGPVAFHATGGVLGKVSAGGSIQSTGVRVSGVVTDETGARKSFRDRPAIVTLRSGVMHLKMRQWNAGMSGYMRPRNPDLWAADARIDLNRIQRIEAGLAYLARGPKPALAFGTGRRRVLLTFDSSSTLQDVVSAISGGHVRSETTVDKKASAAVGSYPKPLLDGREAASGIAVGALLRLSAQLGLLGDAPATIIAIVGACLTILAIEVSRAWRSGGKESRKWRLGWAAGPASCVLCGCLPPRSPRLPHR